uniref:Testis expressed 12 n=1 Tax=Latimeria chalumnae TaxID=7897 RepID=M3XKC5_LATCH|nr:PREDICTED: testis-expressed sequence 12 protein [Latimeria chalumnae]|eukprot:XP_005987331.1 PREDICTED: testis-expressed sequence 12 protein [Latimeria chalumnae]
MATSATKIIENKGSKRKKETENESSEISSVASPDETDLPTVSDNSVPFSKTGGIETALKDMTKEMKLLLSKCSQILSERTAADASYVTQLDEILKEARAMETHLKQKKEGFRHRLTMIANTLQR